MEKTSALLNIMETRVDGLNMPQNALKWTKQSGASVLLNLDTCAAICVKKLKCFRSPVSISKTKPIIDILLDNHTCTIASKEFQKDPENAFLILRLSRKNYLKN